VGTALHEEPQVPGFRDRTERRRLHEGMVLAIEPFVSTGPRLIQDGGDGWALVVPAPHLTAQYEHTVVVTRRGALIMTHPGA
jgi:methionyl aminopeptidase